MTKSEAKSIALTLSDVARKLEALATASDAERVRTELQTIHERVYHVLQMACAELGS